MCHRSTSPFTVIESGVQHREKVEDLVVSGLRPPDVDVEAYLDDFRRRACRSICTVLIVHDEGGREQLVGHLFLPYPIGPFSQHWTSLIGGNTVEISFLVVDPAFARRGIGRQMLEHALAFAASNHFQPVGAVPAGDPTGHLFTALGGTAHGSVEVGQHQLESYAFPQTPR